MRWRAGVRLACGVALAAAGCGGAPEVPPPAPVSTTTLAAAADEVVARVGGEAITAARLDEAIRLPLHDLERARWELRARRLDEIVRGRVLGPAAAAEGLSIDAYVRGHAGAEGSDAFVAAALAAAGVEITLAEPEPPVVAVSADGRPVRGRPDAPVTVLAFVDLQSPYCARMQPVFARLLARYPEHVRLVARDLPLPVHRDAVRAAEAAACAGAQGAYWPFTDRVLQAQDDLSAAALARHAAHAGVDPARYAACVTSGAPRAAVEADVAAARALGVSVVPTLFVNGRYLRGPQPYDVLAARVEAELRGLGSVPPPAPAAVGRRARARAGACRRRMRRGRRTARRATAHAARRRRAGGAAPARPPGARPRARAGRPRSGLRGPPPRPRAGGAGGLALGGHEPAARRRRRARERDAAARRRRRPPRRPARPHAGDGAAPAPRPAGHLRVRDRVASGRAPKHTTLIPSAGSCGSALR
ncbi:MAG: thioredoxin domain-containing protein [bacterium]|nr:thioredoxin domain-containing protein [bacterium]